MEKIGVEPGEDLHLYADHFTYEFQTLVELVFTIKVRLQLISLQDYSKNAKGHIHFVEKIHHLLGDGHQCEHADYRTTQTRYANILH